MLSLIAPQHMGVSKELAEVTHASTTFVEHTHYQHAQIAQVDCVPQMAHVFLETAWITLIVQHCNSLFASRQCCVLTTSVHHNIQFTAVNVTQGCATVMELASPEIAWTTHGALDSLRHATIIPIVFLITV